MSKRMLLWHLAAISTSILLVLWWIAQLHSTQSNDAYPNRPIQVVVPYAAGGGSDTFVRILQKGIAANALLNQPLVIINQPGGSGTIGSREVKNAEARWLQDSVPPQRHHYREAGRDRFVWARGL